MKRRIKLWILRIVSFLVSIAPITIVVCLNLDKYVKEPSDTVKLCLGAILAIVFVALKVLGKLRMPRRVIFFAMVFAIAFLFESLLVDLKLLSGMALLGEAIDYVFFQTAIKRAEENIVVGKTADATTKQVEEVLQKYIGRV